MGSMQQEGSHSLRWGLIFANRVDNVIESIPQNAQMLETDLRFFSTMIQKAHRVAGTPFIPPETKKILYIDLWRLKRKAAELKNPAFIQSSRSTVSRPHIAA